MKIRDEIWVLKDSRPGTMTQSLGLAEEMGFEYQVIDVSYGFFSFLPNSIFQKSLIRLDKDSRENLKKISYLPRFIISAGRRAASIALFLKEKSQNQSQVIQIMNPNIKFSDFDFVILPKHDSVRDRKSKNLIRTIGSLTKTDSKLIKEEKEKFSSWFKKIKNKKIAVMLGGSSKNNDFSISAAIKLAKKSSQLAKKMNATLLVLASPRTGEEISRTFEKNLDCEYNFFGWNEYKKENPYKAVLGWADFFIVTGDSVSMISECCSTKKPVYIFDDRLVSTKKHRRFHHNLFDEGYAKKLSADLKSLKNFSPKRLEETKKVAKIIKNKLSRTK